MLPGLTVRRSAYRLVSRVSLARPMESWCETTKFRRCFASAKYNTVRCWRAYSTNIRRVEVHGMKPPCRRYRWQSQSHTELMHTVVGWFTRSIFMIALEPDQVEARRRQGPVQNRRGIFGNSGLERFDRHSETLLRAVKRSSPVRGLRSLVNELCFSRRSQTALPHTAVTGAASCG